MDRKKEFLLIIFKTIFIALVILTAIDLTMNKGELDRITKLLSNQEEVFEVPASTNDEPITVKDPSDPDIINIDIEPMMEFSGMKVDKILSLRKNAVLSSPLLNISRNYEPSAEVFRIEDDLPWISAYEILYNDLPNKNVGKGLSRESIGILNPELMYYLTVPSRHLSKYKISFDKSYYLMPYRAYYNKNTNTVTAIINYSKLDAKNEKIGYNIFAKNFMTDTNARDMGYKYGYADIAQNIKFDTNKFQTEGIMTVGYYHRGYACQLDSGCNNYSPYETGYDFTITDHPARMRIKMWKNEPSNPATDKADLNYEIIFD